MAHKTNASAGLISSPIACESREYAVGCEDLEGIDGIVSPRRNRDFSPGR